MNAAVKTPGKGRLVAHIILKYLGRILLLALVAAAGAALILLGMLKMACQEETPAVKKLFASTILETGALKWTAKLVMTEEEINGILSSNGLAEMDAEIDTAMISIPKPQENQESTDEKDSEPFDINGITVEKVSGRTFEATMLIVNDPSRITVETTWPTWYRMNLQELVELNDSLGGINGGIYDQTKWMPICFTISHGNIVLNKGAYKGLYLIGFDTDDILRIIDTQGVDAVGMKKLVEENHIRDAVVFPEINDAEMYHFVKLVINGEPREIIGTGSGCNPRTAIGQRADGSVLMLVTDGRGCNGHLGATAQDLIDVMMDYGAVNAANIDGGSSSAMFYDGEYLMTSTTLYVSNSSYPVPSGFMIERRGEADE